MIAVTSLKRLISGVAATALTCGLITLAAPAAIAAPAKAATVSRPAVALTSFAVADDAVTSDSTLSALSVTNNSVSALQPLFASGTLYYEVLENDDASATITPTPTAAGATAVVATDNTTDPLVSGSATAPLTRGRNDITVTVTSADLSTTTVYHVTVWRLAAPVSQIVGIADVTTTVYGGTILNLTVTHGQYPVGCEPFATIGGEGSYIFGSTLDPTSGLTKLQIYVPAAVDYAPGTADLVLAVECEPLGGGGEQALTTAVGAVTYTAGYHVDSADIPATVTSGSEIELNGTNVASYAAVQYWMTDAQGNTQTLGRIFDGNNTAFLYAPYANGEDVESWFGGTGPRTLHVGTCPSSFAGDLSTCTSVFSQTFNWVAPTPAGVSFSPAGGPQAGGTTITLTGRFIVSGTNATTIKVGGQTVPTRDITTVYSSVAQGGTLLNSLQGDDVISFPAPARPTAGTVPITVTNDLGTTTALGTYTYSEQPSITTIAPSTVANSGGSVITVHGTAFGTSGTPTVIIAGVKSPLVTRISATLLTAIVPAATSTTGPVTVLVASPQGGGISPAATLHLIAPSTLPTIATIAPTSGQVTDDVTLTGTGFGPSGTAGVSVDGDWAVVTASSPTSLTFEVPSTGTTGPQDVVVGATTGAVTRTDGFTVRPDTGIAAVTPSTVPSYATGDAAKVAIDGAGFGPTGTVKVGAAAAVPYTATGSGTHIAGVLVPTNAAGSLPILVTPAHATTALRASVYVTAPSVSYVGPDPHQAAYGPVGGPGLLTGLVLDVPTTGGTAMRIEGSGFGPAGMLRLGSTVVTTTSWTDTAITFTAPAHAAGPFAAVVTPTGSTLSAARSDAVDYVAAAVGPPTIGQIASVID